MRSIEKAVLWDMDGVIFDTADVHFQSWKQTLEAYQIHFDRDYFRKIFGRKNSDFMEMLFGKTPEAGFIEELVERKEKLFREMCAGQDLLLPGAQDWLVKLKQQGFKQAVASSAPQANIDLLVDPAGIRDYFDAIVPTGDLPGKPDPAVFLKAASLLNVPPERCVVVEDAVAGVEAAYNGGMKCIAVTTSHPAQALEKADIITASLEFLPENVFQDLLGLNGKSGLSL